MKTQLHSNRGSALVVSLLFAAAMFISVAAYLSTVNLNLKLSHRNHYSSAALNLAENGLEEALWAINRLRTTGDASGFATSSERKIEWSTEGSTATATIRNAFQLGASATDSVVTVVVENYDLSQSSHPKITAKASINIPGGAPVEKWVQLTLDAVPNASTSSTGNPFPGLVAKYNLSFSGNNPTVDSWDSDPDGLPSTVPVGYSSAVKNDQGFVGSLAVEVNQVSVSNADILGHVKTFKDAVMTDNVGPNGSIKGFKTPAGVKIDYSRVSTNFVATLEVVKAPTQSSIPLGDIGNSLSLPRKGDAPIIDATGAKHYYYNFTDIKLSSDKKLEITDSNVILVGSGAGHVSFSGKAELNIATGASLKLYTAGNISLTGQGVNNGTRAPRAKGESEDMKPIEAQQPIMFQVWGTAEDTDGNDKTYHQSIKVSGNGAFSGVIYAPNADVDCNGNGEILGSVVANTIKMTGNGVFHYDESLGKKAWGTPADSQSSPLQVSKWRELLGSETHF